MLSNLYLLKYNNYINRILKLETTLTGYTAHQVGKQTAVNFFRGDELNTTHVCNVSEQVAADYLVETQATSAGEIIVSRWFIMDKQRTSQTQVQLSLRRDVLAENRAPLMAAEAFIQRGALSQKNPLIFNSEGNSYNQIKKSEHLLKDGTGTAWIIGYLADNFLDGQDRDISIAGSTAYTETYTDAAAVVAAYPGTSLTSAQTIGTTYITPSQLSFVATVVEGFDNANRYNYLDGRTSWENVGAVASTMNITVANRDNARATLSANSATSAQIKAALIADKNVTEIYGKVGTVIRVGTTSSDYQYYKLTLNGTENRTFTNVTAGTNVTALIKANAQSIITAGYATGTTTNITPRVSYGQVYRTYEWVNVTVETNATISGTVSKVDTSPYYMFAVPYSDMKFITGSTAYTSSRSDALAVVNAIIKQFNAYIYDVQLLPYFPGTEALVGEAISLDSVSTNNYTVVKSGGTPTTFLYWCTRSSFSLSSYYSIPLQSDVKVQNETQLVRICSPNYASIYEFSAAKNGGVARFTIDCTYKPWQPYIHVAPDWGGLYGTDFDDPRGLICSGDFSLDIATDAWAQYQANNKNYQLMFDRQIQTMDMMHGQQTLNQVLGILAGGLSSYTRGNAEYRAALEKGSLRTANATLAGSIAGGIANAAVGTVGLVQGIQARANERSQAVDMFNYELGNVKARPDTLTKVSALNANNKLFPLVEIYEATAEEVDALKDQIKYGGVKVGIVGTVKDYVKAGQNSFIQARLIRISINDEPHVAQALADELAAGFYFN